MSTGEPLRIVDFSTHLSGPLASHLLAELGADVIKVEHPIQGDGNRGNEPKFHGVSDLHVALNSGTRSISISTRSEHWAEVTGALTGWSDAVIVGSRPSDAARRGLDYASLLKSNSKLVYCLVSGFGLTGPWADFKAHGQTMDALAGRVDIEWVDGQPKTKKGWRSAGAPLAGVFGAMGVLAGVTRRDRGGGPQFVHASIWDSAMWWNWRDVNSLANTQEPWHEYQSLGSRYAMYSTSDERALLLCPLERVFWQKFCDLASLSDEYRERGNWEHSMDFGYDDEAPVIAAAVAARSLNEWVTELTKAEIPFAPILTLEEAMNSEHAEATGLLRGTMLPEGRARISSSPVGIYQDQEDAESPAVEDLSSPPDLGAHNKEILGLLGLNGLQGVDLSGGLK
ncbi:MAG: CaiB/BaiF CoA-transferase family protein [Acidimicrobiales bacterium]|nr:CaiB/BaiF CoA-transferase family protein [Acidimicrobiales bacterium]